MRFTVALTESDYLQAQQVLLRERKAAYLCTQIGWALLFLLGCIPAAMSYLTDGTIDPVALLFGAPAWLFCRIFAGLQEGCLAKENKRWLQCKSDPSW